EKHTLYAGIIVSPDISTVKMQHVNKLGMGAGIILGYSFDKMLSVESGILFDKKTYYSKGEYVNTKRIAVPNYSHVKDVNGVCNMIEIPLNLKYNFQHSGRSFFAAAAGVSSYLMQKEVYNYTYDYNTWQAHVQSTYKKSSTDLLAVVNLSLGYNRILSRNTSLFVMPYFKVPLKGVGIGSLPITSTGINIGITHQLVKF
ncbi:MAG: hypothetical protein ABJA57_04765, partial [Ginsengibacter sp.]